MILSKLVDYHIPPPDKGHTLLGVPPATSVRRSSSVSPGLPTARQRFSRSGSESKVPIMAAVTTFLPRSGLRSEVDSLSTLPDPRSPDLSSMISRSASSSPHPDLNSEVATLSNKLISAINHQTSLDDNLTGTRHELAEAKRRIEQLETEIREHNNQIATGLLVRKAEVNDESDRLVAKLAEERQRRLVVEKDKKGIEQELETLTTALFEEANQMVAAARRKTDAAERKNEQLRAQINDTELLLSSHQEQLAELKTVMQNMSSDRDEPDTITNASTAPSTPALPNHSDLSKIFDALHISSTAPGMDDTPPAPPTSFSHLLSPVLRTDLQSYEDFRSLLQISRKSAPASRVSSGSYTGVNVLGLNSTANRDGNHQISNAPSSASTTSLSTPATLNPSPSTTPNTPASTTSSISSPLIPLKETRFYKRALTEDIEPTLRLDTAPGLSWLARRTVINSMSEGSLMVEPMPVSIKMNIFSCSLCGENRKGEEFTRTHRFRTSESESAQRYPLCSYCLNRVRASCDYLGFLRMVKDGYWRTDGSEAEKIAWEESVRLRERMFWARIGGGVVPAFLHARESPRISVEDVKPSTPSSAPPVLSRETSVSSQDLSKENDDPFRSSAKRVSIGKTMISRKESKDTDWESARKAAIFDDTPPSPRKPIDPSAKQLQNNLQDSLKRRSKPNLKVESNEKAFGPLPQVTNEQGLSITIPGAFNF